MSDDRSSTVGKVGYSPDYKQNTPYHDELRERLKDGGVWGSYVERLRNLEDDAKKLAWFYKMIASGGPDHSDLDALVEEEAREAAERVLRLLVPENGSSASPT